MSAVPVSRKIHTVSRIMYLKTEAHRIPQTEFSEHLLTTKNPQTRERQGFMTTVNWKSDLKILFSMEFRR